MKTRDRLHTDNMNGAPSWKRWLALLSVVLLVLVPQAHSVLQHGLAAHISHAVPQTATTAVLAQDLQLTDDDTPCTLCSVLGTATQLANYQCVRPVEQTLKRVAAEDRAVVPQLWHFDRFSRPPPSSLFGEVVAG